MLSDGDGKVEATAEGNGMIDAAIAAIAEATGVSGTVLDFNVSSVTGGGDAFGDVVIQLDVDGLKVTGRGVATDVVEASARAYLTAVNRIVRMRERPMTARRHRRAMTVNLWTDADARAVRTSSSASTIPRRAEGYAVLLEFLPERVEPRARPRQRRRRGGRARPRGATRRRGGRRRLLRGDARPGRASASRARPG